MDGAVVPPERLGRTSLRDGRMLAWAEWGPADGDAVVFCPGAGTGRSLGFAADALQDLGVRLVSADRPGLGASDPDPGRTLLDWADDVSELARERELGEPAVLGFSQGAPFALACAAGGVARAAAVVSGTDELAHPAFADVLDPQLRAMIDDPAGAAAGLAEMDAERLGTMVIQMSADIDRRMYAEESFAAAFGQALGEGFAQGPAGYLRDTVLAMSPWPFDVAEIRVPVQLWYGRQDTSPVHSPDFGATLAGRIPDATLHVDPRAGGALLWTHGAEILGRLVA